ACFTYLPRSGSTIATLEEVCPAGYPRRVFCARGTFANPDILLVRCLIRLRFPPRSVLVLLGEAVELLLHFLELPLERVDVVAARSGRLFRLRLGRATALAHERGEHREGALEQLH